MTVRIVETITKDRLEEYIQQAANAAGYEQGFGVSNCDLSKPIWWAAYCRQSLDQQANNNRLPEYLLTMARMAKEQGVAIPREYIFYDHETGEHLDRPDMNYLRHEIVHKKRVVGVIFADLRCLSREPAPQQVFERECEILVVRLLFGDAPSGMDVGSQFARSALTFSNKLSRLATNRNARAGNIGRVLKGWVPACRAPYGYIYRRDAEITQGGKLQIKKAWWEIEALDEDNNTVPDSPTDIILRIFHWIADEERTTHWIARELNQTGIRAPLGGEWSPGKVQRLVSNRCYTGKHCYNAYARVPNPGRPIGDITGAIKRSLLRPKPDGEVVTFEVPQIISEELWQKTVQILKQRGCGRGKQGRAIQALLRNRIFCPKCGRPLVVRRKSSHDRLYYYCSRYYHSWTENRCGFNKFLSGLWEDSVWDCVCALLMQDGWVEEHVGKSQKDNEAYVKLMKQEERKITQLQSKIKKIREGFEAELYTIEEAKARIADYRNLIAKSEQEIERLGKQMAALSSISVDPEALRQELQRIAHINLSEASFEEKRSIIEKLGIKIYPSEDLKHH